MNFPKITIITPSYNQGNFLEQTILSVLNQNYPNLEYMVIDGGSTDSSVQIINQYKNRLAWSVSEKDNGQPHAINKGLKKATGEIISWINSDDFLHENSLFKIAESFSDPLVNCTIGKIQYFIGSQNMHRSRNVVKGSAEETLGSGVVPQPAMYFRKECYDKLGLLDERLNLCFDGEWYMRYLIHYGIEKIIEIPDVIAHFRYHQHSKTMNQGNDPGDKNGFQQERASICFSIASQFNMKPLMKLLSEYADPDLSYHFAIPDNPQHINIEKAMNYFTFLLANEFYAGSQHEKAAQFFNAVKAPWLDEKNRLLYVKLKFRNRFLPAKLIKILRNRKR